MLASALVSIVAVGASCSGGESRNSGVSMPARAGDSATPGTTSAAVSAATKPASMAAAVPAGAPQIDQINQIFSPSRLTVKVGDTVYFLNNDNGVVHSVNINGKNLLGQNAQMKKGDVAAWKASAAGSYQITCDFHPAMAASITVQ